MDKRLKATAIQAFVIMAGTVLIMGGVFLYSDRVNGSNITHLVNQKNTDFNEAMGQ
jgi:hypothetical protein